MYVHYINNKSNFFFILLRTMEIYFRTTNVTRTIHSLGIAAVMITVQTV